MMDELTKTPPNLNQACIPSISHEVQIRYLQRACSSSIVDGIIIFYMFILLWVCCTYKLLIKINVGDNGFACPGQRVNWNEISMLIGMQLDN